MCGIGVCCNCLGNTIVSLWEFALFSGSMLSFRFDLGIVFFLAQDAEGILMKMMMCLKQQKKLGWWVMLNVHPEFVGK